MNFRNKNKIPDQQPIPSELPEVPKAVEVEERLFPDREGDRLNVTVDELDKLQETFMKACSERGMDAAAAAAAMRDAMQAGVLPGALSMRLRRDNSRELFIPHGNIPDGVIQMKDYEGKLFLEKPDDSLPTVPDPQDPDAFYLEHHKVEGPGRIGIYGDDRDRELALKLKDLNGQLSQMIAPPADAV